MSERTLQQHLMAYGSENFSVVAKINNAVIYDGEIAVSQATLPIAGEDVVGTSMITWTLPIKYRGTVDLDILVVSGPSDGRIILTGLTANHTWEHFDDNRLYMPSGVDKFIPYWIADEGGARADPTHTVSINGLALMPPRGEDRFGYWKWRLAVDDTFSAKVDVPSGGEITVWDPTIEYSWGGDAENGTGDDLVLVTDDNNNTFVLWALTAPAGTPLTDNDVWRPVN